MPDINQLFDKFPDYDVFTGKTTPAKKRRVRKATAPAPQNNGHDYRDGYGIVKERRAVRSNFATVFFFPVVIMWFELFMRIAARCEFNIVSIIYTFLFIMPISCVLTFACTFAGEKVNRIICNVIVFLLTLIFEAQLIYFGKYSAFFTFSGSRSGALSFSDIMSSITQNVVCFVAMLVPLLFSLTVGRFIFRFKKIRIPAKISLILVAVLFQILAMTAVSFSKASKNPISSYRLYNVTFNSTPSQERFGLLTTEILDIKNTLS